MNQAKVLSDRLAAATQFKHDHGTQFTWDVLADSMENTFHHSFGAWPTRYYILHKGKLAFKIEHTETREF